MRTFTAVIILSTATITTGNTCKSCVFGGLEKSWGYSGAVFEEGKSSAHHAGIVQFTCNSEAHLFFCNNGEWKPLLESQSICGVKLECDALDNAATAPYDIYTYDEPATKGVVKEHLPGKYRNGTVVTRSCWGTEVIGSTTSTCTYGTWTPAPGRCPPMCSVEKLKREAGFSRVTIYEWPHPDWARHGQKAQGFCSRTILEVQHEGFTCNQGKWEPENFKCPEHLRTHYQ